MADSAAGAGFILRKEDPENPRKQCFEVLGGFYGHFVNMFSGKDVLNRQNKEKNSFNLQLTTI